MDASETVENVTTRANPFKHLSSNSGGRLADRVYLKRGSYYFRLSPDHRAIRLGSTSKDRTEGLRKVRAGEIVPKRLKGRPLPATTRETMLLRAIEAERMALVRARQQMLSSIRARSKRATTMTAADIEAMWQRSGGQCEVTGIRFSMERLDGCLKRPWSPSIDRIDSAGGYTPDNCRLVCTAVNLAMNEFGIEVLRQIACAMVRDNTG